MNDQIIIKKSSIYESGSILDSNSEYCLQSSSGQVQDIEIG